MATPEQERNEEIRRRIAEFQKKENETSTPSVRSETERLIAQAKSLGEKKPVKISHEKIEKFVEGEKRGRGRPKKVVSPATEDPKELPKEFGEQRLSKTTSGQTLRALSNDKIKAIFQNIDTSKLNMKKPQRIGVTHSSNDKNLLMSILKDNKVVARFVENDTKTYLKLDQSLVDDYNSKNLSAQIEPNEKGEYIFEVESLRLTKNMTIEDLRVSSQTKCFDILFSALGLKVTKEKEEGYVRNTDTPFDIQISKRFIDRVFSDPVDEICYFDNEEPAKSAILIAEAHLQREIENPEKSKEIVTSTIGSGKNQITLTSYPITWIDKKGEKHSDYLYTMKEGKNTYIYSHVTTEKSRTSLTAARFMKIREASLEATALTDDTLDHPVLYLGVTGGTSVNAIEIPLNLADEATKASLISLRETLSKEFQIEKRSGKKEAQKLTEGYSISSGENQTTFDVYNYTQRSATTLYSLGDVAILSASEKPLEKTHEIDLGPTDPGPSDPGPSDPGPDLVNPGPIPQPTDPDDTDAQPDPTNPGPQPPTPDGDNGNDPGQPPENPPIDESPSIPETDDSKPPEDDSKPPEDDSKPPEEDKKPQKSKFRFNTKNLSKTNKNYLIGAFALITVLSCLVPGLSIVSAVLLAAIGIDTFVDLGVISTLLNKGLDAIDKLKQPKKVKEKTYIKTLNKTLSKQKELNKENKKIRAQIEEIQKSNLSPEEKQKKIEKLQKELDKNEENLHNLFNDKGAQERRARIAENKALIEEIESRQDMSNYEKKRQIKALQKQIDKDNDYLYSHFSVETISAYAKYDPDGAIMFCQTYLAHGKELHEDSIQSLESISAHLLDTKQDLEKKLDEEKTTQTALGFLVEQTSSNELKDSEKDFLSSIAHKNENELTPEELEMLKKLKGKFGIGLLARLRARYGECSTALEEQAHYVRDVEAFIETESQKTNPDGTRALTDEQIVELQERIKQANQTIASIRQEQAQVAADLSSLNQIPLDPSQMRPEDIAAIDKLFDDAHGRSEFLRAEISGSTETSTQLNAEIEQTEASLRETDQRIQAENEFDRTIREAQDSIRSQAGVDLESVEISGEQAQTETPSNEETDQRRRREGRSRSRDEEGRDR